MNWDALQRDVLMELGHVLLVPRGTRFGDAGGAISNPSPQPLGADELLLKHLLRASGRDVGSVAEVMAVVQSLDGLRGNAAAKRALWPLLRVLRRS